MPAIPSIVLPGGQGTSRYMEPPVPRGVMPPSQQELMALAARQRAWEEQQRQQLSGLPEAVQRSIHGQPSYGEGEWMPPRWPQATDVQREFDTHDPDAPTARNDQLESQLWQNRIFPGYDVPLAEGEQHSDIGPPRATYPSPLDQLMWRGPLALY